MNFSFLVEVNIPDEKIQDISLKIPETLGLTYERCEQLMGLSTTIPVGGNFVQELLNLLNKGAFTDNELLFLFLTGIRHKEALQKYMSVGFIQALRSLLSRDDK